MIANFQAWESPYTPEDQHRTWKWWFGSDEFPFPGENILRFQPLIFRGVRLHDFFSYFGRFGGNEKFHGDTVVKARKLQGAEFGQNYFRDRHRQLENVYHPYAAKKKEFQEVKLKWLYFWSSTWINQLEKIIQKSLLVKP